MQTQLANMATALTRWLKALGKQVPRLEAWPCPWPTWSTRASTATPRAVLHQRAVPTWLKHAAQIKLSMSQVRGKTDKAASCAGVRP